MDELHASMHLKNEKIQNDEALKEQKNWTRLIRDPSMLFVSGFIFSAEINVNAALRHAFYY